MKTKNNFLFLLTLFFLYFPLDSFAQKDNEDVNGDFITVSSRDAIPVKRILVVNGVLVKDSLTSVRLKSELVNFKTKTKSQIISENVAKELGINYNTYKLYYKFEIIEVKDVIIDPETMKLIRIK